MDLDHRNFSAGSRLHFGVARGIDALWKEIGKLLNKVAPLLIREGWHPICLLPGGHACIAMILLRNHGKVCLTGGKMGRFSG
jgi:hypothetical protein